MSDDAPLVPGRPGHELTPAQAAARRENRLRTRIGVALLRKVDGKDAPTEAVQYLRDVAAGRVDVAERTRVAASVALLRAGLDVGQHVTRGGPALVVNTTGPTTITSRPSIETIRAALAALSESSPFPPSSST